MKTKRTRIFALLLIAVLALSMNACGVRGGDEIYVQSVASLNGMGALGFTDRFAGVAQAGKTVELRLDAEMKLDELRVEEGQVVKKGDVLFTYNNEAAALRVEQAKLELEQKKNEITALRAEIESLSTERSYASADQKLSYTLEIQSREADIREAQYDISVKEQELKRLEETVSETQVKSEVDGRVTQISKNGAEYNDDGSEQPFMTVIETGSLRVKGVINELNRGMLTEGQAVTVRSRTDEAQTWQGVIKTIDWENAEQSNQAQYYGYYGAEGEMTVSSRYPFYVELEESEGLLIGQHVYIEPGAEAEADDALYLPAAFVEEEDDAYYVWAANARDKLERRSVSLSETDDGTGRYKIEDGLTAEDYIAFPDGTLQAGMSVIRTEGNVPDLIGEQDFEGDAFVSDDDMIVFEGAEAPDDAQENEAAENAQKEAAEEKAEEETEAEAEAETAAAASEG
ncbi:MAG: HlyD family efflux transporter periplasmic adaptor subunit [Clostridia bacterium]|nr:HlyD family efflux transporter periplasmic adaptor subunit [Clostridia bacterium]